MRIGLPIIAAILSACGGGATTANVIGSANAADVEAQRRAPPRVRAAAPASSWNGIYRGRGDGSSNVMEIRPGNGPGRHRVSIGVSGLGGCDGQIEGEGVASGNRLRMAVSVPENGEICVVTADRRGGTVTVREQGCLYFHGAQCRFDMTATRARR
jgi:hypothetical protein